MPDQAFVDFIMDYTTQHKPPPYGDMMAAMEFGVRAFVALVNERAVTSLRKATIDVPDDEIKKFHYWPGELARTFDEAVRELLGE